MGAAGSWAHSVAIHFIAASVFILVPSAMQEWITPQPSRRPDPVPDFEKLETPKIRPLPEQPDEEEMEEEEKKKKEKEDPDKEQPDPAQPDPPEK